MLDRLDDAMLTVGLATERKLGWENHNLVLYFVACLQGNDDELRRTAERARKSRATEDMISHLEALRLARSGRVQDARRISAVAVEIAQRGGGRGERAGLFEAATAVWEALYGNAAAARQGATKALALGRGRDVDYAAALALALSGDLPRARALADDLARQFPEDTFVQFMYLPTLRALFSLHARDSATAIQALQIASRYDLALGGVGFNGHFGGLYPIYVRGLAYLAARQSAEAAGEFQRILDHRSIVLVDPMYALARRTWHERSHWRATPPRRRAPTPICCLCGGTPTAIPMVEAARAESARLR